jgi:hypothetical protein
VFSLYTILGARAVTNVIIAYNKTLLTSAFSREVTDNCAIIGYYAANGGHSLPALQDNVAVPSSGFKNLSAINGLGPCLEGEAVPETSVWNYPYSLRNILEERSCQEYAAV